MEELNEFQIQFMKAMADVQEDCVSDALYGKHDYSSREEEMYALTSELICQIMAVIDGYGHSKIEKLDIVCEKAGQRLKENPFIELHDVVCDYIKM